MTTPNLPPDPSGTPNPPVGIPPRAPPHSQVEIWDFATFPSLFRTGRGLGNALWGMNSGKAPRFPWDHRVLKDSGGSWGGSAAPEGSWLVSWLVSCSGVPEQPWERHGGDTGPSRLRQTHPKGTEPPARAPAWVGGPEGARGGAGPAPPAAGGVPRAGFVPLVSPHPSRVSPEPGPPSVRAPLPHPCRLSELSHLSFAHLCLDIRHLRAVLGVTALSPLPAELARLPGTRGCHHRGTGDITAGDSRAWGRRHRRTLSAGGRAVPCSGRAFPRLW